MHSLQADTAARAMRVESVRGANTGLRRLLSRSVYAHRALPRVQSARTNIWEAELWEVVSPAERLPGGVWQLNIMCGRVGCSLGLSSVASERPCKLLADGTLYHFISGSSLANSVAALRKSARQASSISTMRTCSSFI